VEDDEAVASRRGQDRRHRRPEIATFLSFLWPGVGQLYAGRRLLALLFALPILAIVVVAGVAFLNERQFLAFRLFQPGVAVAITLAIVTAGLWRLAAMVHANAAAGGQRAFTGRPILVLAVLAIVVVGAHVGLARVAWSFHTNAPRIFVATNPNPAVPAPVIDPTPTPPPGSTPLPVPSEDLPAESPLTEPPPSVPPASAQPPPPSDRVNILIAGLDSAPGRSHELTDTLIVVSVDKTTREVAMVSFPRDIASFPLSDGRTYRGKINSLLTYARQHEDQFRAPPMSVLAGELGYLLGIQIDHYAAINLEGFERLIDTVGGVTVNNERRLVDPSLLVYRDNADRPFTVEAGLQTLNGRDALMFVRSRHGSGGSDFARATRQQAVLLGLRNKLTDPAMLPRLPEILDALAGTITTNYPPERLAETIDLGRNIDDASIRRYVLGPPYSWHPPTDQTGGSWELRLYLDRVAELSIDLFGAESRYAQLLGTP